MSQNHFKKKRQEPSINMFKKKEIHTTTENEWITPHKNIFKKHQQNDNDVFTKPTTIFSLNEEVFPTLNETHIKKTQPIFTYSNVVKQVQEDTKNDEEPRLKSGYLYIYEDGSKEFSGYSTSYYKTMELVESMKYNKFFLRMERNHFEYEDYCEWRDGISQFEEHVYNWEIEDYFREKEFEKYITSLEEERESIEEHEQETEASDLEY